jgi:multisubunit Na+/H+ antiporter MnhE subunit
VNSVYRLVVFGGQPLGALFIGWLLQTFGVAWALWINAAIFAAIALAVTLNSYVRHAHLLTEE